MKEINAWNSLPGTKRSIVTLGKFDGLHRGHLKLIHQLQKEHNEQLVSVVFIFDIAEQRLLTKEERLQYLNELGIDYVAECPLDEKIKKMSAEDFVKDILVKNLRISKVVIGEEFHFGYQRKGTVALLQRMGKELGFEVEAISHEMEENEKISSTLVREQLAYGNLEKVTTYLGRHFTASGEVLHGRGIGHKKLLPTINLIPSKEKILPPNGVYVTISRFEDKCFGGITNIGYKPTVGGEDFLGIETYLFLCKEDLYGKEVIVEFLKYLRPERKFSDLENLRQQLQHDIEQGNAYLSTINFHQS